MELLEFNDLQEKLLDEYIEKGGIGFEYQSGRGYGYTTFILVQAIQQATTSGRRVYFIDDLKHDWTMSECCKVAYEFFGYEAVLNRARGTVRVGGAEIIFVKPQRHRHHIYGLEIHDVYGEISRETIDQHEEFFYELMHRQRPPRDQDGTGFRYFVIR